LLFRRKEWIFVPEQCNTNLWKFLGNDVVNEDDDAVVVSSVANAEDDESEKKKDIISRQGNGEEFFLK